MITEETDQPTNEVKFYSQRAIGISTYIGGPLAAGVLLRENFAKDPATARYSKYVLPVAVLFTVLLFAGLFSLPEKVLDQIPHLLVPAMYTAVSVILVEILQGSTLKAHKQASGGFHSGWKAAKIVVLCLAITLAGAVGLAFLMPDAEAEKYDAAVAQFQQNEEAALELYNMLETEDEETVVHFIESTGLPAWRENLQLLDEMDGLDVLPEYKAQNEILREYCQLRVESYELLRKAVQQNTSAYDERLQKIHFSIDETLANL